MTRPKKPQNTQMQHFKCRPVPRKHSTKGSLNEPQVLFLYNSESRRIATKLESIGICLAFVLTPPTLGLPSSTPSGHQSLCPHKLISINSIFLLKFSANPFLDHGSSHACSIAIFCNWLLLSSSSLLSLRF